MELNAIARVLGELAPLGGAEPWDNVGLLAGEPKMSVTRALFTVDLTLGVVDEAVESGAELVVAYHPPIFGGLKRVAFDTALGAALRHGIALYSPHTALDVAPLGTNDVLARIVRLREAKPLRDSSRERDLKLVVFVPEADVDRVADAMFAAGAGRIGDYERCSYRLAGQGTFFGNDSTNPAVGKKGTLERVDEIRLELVVPSAKLGVVVEALRGAHPYEEPAFDVYATRSVPRGGGIGRVGRLDPIGTSALVARIKKGLGIEEVLVAAPDGAGDRMHRAAAVSAGSAGDMWKEARRFGADVYVTGEMRHHDALAAVAAGVTVICTLHSNSERVALKEFADRVRTRLDGVNIDVSKIDRDPFVFS